jgi:hypothetical protein
LYGSRSDHFADKPALRFDPSRVPIPVGMVVLLCLGGLSIWVLAIAKLVEIF